MSVKEEKRDWKQLRTIRLLQISPTQVETYDICIRKWWLKAVRKLKESKTYSQVFGTVLHSVIERFLLADDLGNDTTTGKPIELFPPKWHFAKSRNKDGDGEEIIEGELGMDEQVIVQKLILAAIEDGTLYRPKDRAIEHQVNMQVLTDQLCPTCNGLGQTNQPMPPGMEHKCPICNGDGRGTTVMLNGFIDLMKPGGIEDHKSVKLMKYAKSQKALAANMQALIYAKYLVTLLQGNNLPVPDAIELRHNAYCKNPDDLRVRKTAVDVKIPEIETAWLGVIERAKKMVFYRDTVDHWFQIPDPPNRSKSCNMFGGCSFMPICNGQEDEIGYEKRLDKFSAKGIVNLPSATTQSNNSNPYTGKDHLMSANPSPFAAVLARQAAAQAAAGSATAPAVVQTPAPAAVVAQPAAPVQTQVAAPVIATAVAAQGMAIIYPPGTIAPPWANPACQACEGLAFNSRQSPCRICTSVATDNGRPTPDQFIITATSKGTAVWQKINDDSVAGESPLYRTPPTAAVKQEARTDPAPAAVVAQPAAPVQTQVAAPAESKFVVGPIVATSAANEAAESEEKKTGGRPKKGFILCINCVVHRGEERKPGSGRYVYHLTDVLKDLMPEIAKLNGKESFYDIDAFARRDALAKAAPLIAEQFKNDIVVVSGVGSGQSELRVLLDGIRPYATMEISAVLI